jgi:hypothetical protein
MFLAKAITPEEKKVKKKYQHAGAKSAACRHEQALRAASAALPRTVP